MDSQKLSELLDTLVSLGLISTKIVEKVTISDPCCNMGPNNCDCDPWIQSYHYIYEECDLESIINPYYILVEIYILDQWNKRYLIGRYPLPWFREGERGEYPYILYGRTGYSENGCSSHSKLIPSVLQDNLKDYTGTW